MFFSLNPYYSKNTKEIKSVAAKRSIPEKWSPKTEGLSRLTYAARSLRLDNKICKTTD